MKKETIAMKIVSATLACTILGVAVCAAPAAAQEKKDQPPTGAAQAMPLPKPGPEQDLLKKDVGAWDAVVESWMGPGQAAPPSKGVSTSTLGMGGLWLVTDFKSDFMGMPFIGHGVMGYDSTKKKYVGTWVDSMSFGLGLSEGTYDAATKTLNETMEGPDAGGKMMTMRMATVWKDADTKVWSMYAPGPDGKEFQMMRITYTRKK
jgi:hypothetical protein